MLGALIVISMGVEVAKLNVPVEVGRRLFQCDDDLGKEWRQFSETSGVNGPIRGEPNANRGGANARRDLAMKHKHDGPWGESERLKE